MAGKAGKNSGRIGLAAFWMRRVVAGHGPPCQAVLFDGLGQNPDAYLDIATWVENYIQGQLETSEPLRVDLHNSYVERQTRGQGDLAHGQGLLFRGIQNRLALNVHGPGAHPAFVAGDGESQILGDAVPLARGVKETGQISLVFVGESRIPGLPRGHGRAGHQQNPVQR